MRWRELHRLALEDLHRAARLAIVEGQRAYSLGRLPPVCRLGRWYASRARERLADARRLAGLA